MRTLHCIKLLTVFAVAFSLASVTGALSGSPFLPAVQLGHANNQLCETHGSSGACSELWYPAGPAMNTLVNNIFTDEGAEYLNLQSATPSIDLTDWECAGTPTSGTCNTLIHSSPFLVTDPLAQVGYYEIEFMLDNQYWNCGFAFGNSACGIQVRQGIAHMFDKNSYCTNSVVAGICTPIDNPLPTTSIGGLLSPNPCNYDASFPQTSTTNCIVNAPGGTAYHLGSSTGADGFAWLYAPGSLDLNASARHFVNAGVATGFNGATSVLSGVNPGAMGYQTPTFFIRNDNSPRRTLGESLAAQICYVFTGSYTQPCVPFFNTVEGPITAFPGFTTSPTSVNQDWWMYTAAFSGPTFVDGLYFGYNSHFASASCLSPGTVSCTTQQIGGGFCSNASVGTASAANYEYACNTSFDSLSFQMETAPCLTAPGDPTPGQSATLANCSGQVVGVLGCGARPPCGDLTNSANGPVQHNAKDFLIFWEPNGASYDLLTSDANYRQKMIRYFTDICTPNSFYDMLQQYAGSNGNIGACSLGGWTTNSTAYPHPGTPLTQTDIQRTVISAMVNNATTWVSNNGNNSFFVFTNYSVGTSTTEKGACGQHGPFIATAGPSMGQPVSYADMPDVADATGMGVRVDPNTGSSCSIGTPSPNNDIIIDSEISLASHEQFESFTNPLGPPAVGTLPAWYYLNFAHEIGDQCAYLLGPATATGATLIINGNGYRVQTEWSNLLHACSTGISGPLTALSAGIQAEAAFGAAVLTIPNFELTTQWGYLNNGWVRADNGVVAGLPNYFTWLNAWNSAPVQSGTIRQGWKETTRSTSPFIASTVWDFYIDGQVYDSLFVSNPLSPGQLVDWMTYSAIQQNNATVISSSGYTPPPHTLSTYHFTLRNDLFFQDGTPVTAYDVAFSYLSLIGSGAFQASGASIVTGITVLGPRSFDLGVSSLGPFTLPDITGITILPGSYWTGAGPSAWTSAVNACTGATFCGKSQYALNVATVICPSASGQPGCPTGTPQPSVLQVDTTKITATYDPVGSGTLVGSGPWACISSTGVLGKGCSTTGIQNPPTGDSYTLTRYGCTTVPTPGYTAANNCLPTPGSTSGTYFRSSGHLALYDWTGESDTSAVQPVSAVSLCFNAPVPTGSCTHWQLGIGASATGVVGINQVSTVELRYNLNWVAPFEWATNPPLGIGSVTPVLYEGPVTLNPCSIQPTTGYDC